MVMIKDKHAFEFSFSWIFAIIVGAVILFLAIFVSMNLIKGGEYEINIKTARSVLNTFEYIQTQTEESSVPPPLQLLKQTKIFTSCDSQEDFGEASIAISEVSGFSKEYTEKSKSVSTNNLYIFAEDEIEIKKQGNVYFFIMPFKMPFKTGDISIMHSKQYCFVDPDFEIENKISEIAQDNSENMVVEDSISRCEENSVKVCFGGGRGCDVVVDTDGQKGTVSKDGEQLFFIGDLVYAAIFSSAENYECGVKRLITRLEYLSELYYDKAIFVNIRGCSTGLEDEMRQLQGMAEDYRDLGDLVEIKELADEIEQINQDETICQLF